MNRQESLEMNSRLRGKDSLISMKDEEIQYVTSECSRLRESMKSLNESFADKEFQLNKTVSDLYHRNDSLNKDNIHLTNEITSLVSKNSLLNNEIEKKIQDMIHLQEDFVKSQSRLKESMESLNSNEIVINEMKSNISILKSSNSDKEVFISQLELTIQTLQSKLELLTTSLSKIQLEVDAGNMLSVEKDIEIDSLKVDLSKCQLAIEEHIDNNNSLQFELDTERVLLEEKVTLIDSLTVELSRSQLTIQEHKVSYNSLQLEFSGLKVSLESTIVEKQKITDELMETTQLLKDRECEVANLKIEIKNQQVVIQKQKDDANQLQHECNYLKESIESSMRENERIAAELVKISQLLNSKESEIGSLQDEVANYLIVTKVQNDKFDSLQLEYSDLKVSLELLLKEKDSLASELLQTSNELKLNKQYLSVSLVDNEDLKNLKVELGSKIQSCELQIEALNNKVIEGLQLKKTVTVWEKVIEEKNLSILALEEEKRLLCSKVDELQILVCIIT